MIPCKVCRHPSDYHHLYLGKENTIECALCPNRICQPKGGGGYEAP